MAFLPGRLDKMQLRTPVINNSLSLFSLLLLAPSSPPLSDADNGWRGQTMYSCHFYPPPPSLDSTSMNICCVHSDFGEGGKGARRWGQTNLDADCNDFLYPPQPPPSAFFFFSPLLVKLPGGGWEGYLNSEWVSVAHKLLASQIPTLITTADDLENNPSEHSHMKCTYEQIGLI